VVVESVFNPDEKEDNQDARPGIAVTKVQPLFLFCCPNFFVVDHEHNCVGNLEFDYLGIDWIPEVYNYDRTCIK